MKKILIFLILVAFMTVACSGPGKMRWTKPDFRQDQFDKDREDCIQTVKNDPGQKMTVEECLAEKGYKSESEPPSGKEKSTTVGVAKTVGKVFLVVALGAVGVAAFSALLVLSLIAH